MFDSFLQNVLHIMSVQQQLEDPLSVCCSEMGALPNQNRGFFVIKPKVPVKTH